MRIIKYLLPSIIVGGFYLILQYIFWWVISDKTKVFIENSIENQTFSVSQTSAISQAIIDGSSTAFWYSTVASMGFIISLFILLGLLGTKVSKLEKEQKAIQRSENE